MLTSNYLPKKTLVNILITSGASCPDAIVENIIEKLVSYFETEIKMKSLITQFK